MKSIGHTGQSRNLQLDEVVLVATPDELRQIAEFLRNAADRMDDMGADFDHEHLIDYADGFESSANLVAIRGE